MDNAYLIVLAVGMTFVILTGGIDLSRRLGRRAVHGDRRRRTLEAGWPPPLGVVAVLVVGTGLGLLMGLVIHYFDIQPFIVTLAGMFLARGLCYVISVESIPISDPTFCAARPGPDLRCRGGFTTTRPRWSPLVVVVVAVYVLHQTRFGRTVYAVGGNEQSAQLMGLRVARTKVAVYAISGFCASLAGLLFSLYSCRATA